MTRQELANCAGIDRQTLKNWIEPHANLLFEMGMRPRQILPPKVVAWLAERYSIDVDEKRCK